MRYSREFIDELRRRIPLSDLVNRRGVKLVQRGHEYVGLCPFHHERTPSFFVVEDEGFFHCFGCGAHGDAIRFVMRADNVDFRQAVGNLAAYDATAAASLTADTGLPSRAALRDKEERNRRTAWQLWLDAAPARGSIVETYLRSRDLSLPPAPVLRFARCCWNRETGRKLPAMLARVDDADGNFIAVHRTWLQPDGSDKAELAEPKWSLGSLKGGAIRLAPAGPLLAVAEGIENALSVIVAKRIPAWSAVSKAGLKTMPLPGEVREVWMVADHDANGGGELAGRGAAERWAAEGRQVELVELWRSSRPGEDANDLLRKQGENDDVTRGPLEGDRPA